MGKAYDRLNGLHLGSPGAIVSRAQRDGAGRGAFILRRPRVRSGEQVLPADWLVHAEGITNGSGYQYSESRSFPIDSQTSDSQARDAAIAYAQQYATEWGTIPGMGRTLFPAGIVAWTRNFLRERAAADTLATIGLDSPYDVARAALMAGHGDGTFIHQVRHFDTRPWTGVQVSFDRVKGYWVQHEIASSDEYADVLDRVRDEGEANWVEVPGTRAFFPAAVARWVKSALAEGTVILTEAAPSDPITDRETLARELGEAHARSKGDTTPWTQRDADWRRPFYATADVVLGSTLVTNLNSKIDRVRGLIPTANPELIEAGYPVDAKDLLDAIL